MLHKENFSTNMQVDAKTYMNLGASLGEGSEQGNVAMPSQSIWIVQSLTIGYIQGLIGTVANV